MDDSTRRTFKQALEQADKQARGEVVLLPAYIDLAKCWEWINVKAATTGSANILKTILESLANEGTANLSAIRALDGERRVWVASLVTGRGMATILTESSDSHQSARFLLE